MSPLPDRRSRSLLCTVCAVSKYRFSWVGGFPAWRSVSSNPKLLGQAQGQEKIAGVPCKSNRIFICPTKCLVDRVFFSFSFFSPPSHCVTDFVFNYLRPLLWVRLHPKQFEVHKNVLFGGLVPQVQLNIDANNAGTVLPLPGNRAQVARSAEKDAGWWIGFSWSSKCKILSP